MSQATQTVAGRYQLGPTVGRGGMADVHAGHDLRLGREVAIKVLRADLARDPLFRLRFEREAQNVAAMNHPGIVAVYDTGEVAQGGVGLPFIVMEYVSGSTLRDLLRAHGPMLPERACSVMADVCDALGFSHSCGVVHRDVKPANVMITPAEVVKVMDFGIARAVSETQPGLTGDLVIGTAQYLAPEQGLGQAIDARVDVYAAGCVLFELLTGEPPFTGDSPVSIVYQHVREDPPLPSTLAPPGTTISSELDAVVLRALAKNPDNRYQQAQEMRADLVRLLDGQRPLAPAVLGVDDLDADGNDHAGGPSTRTSTMALNPVRSPRTGAHAVVPPPRPGRRPAILVALGLVVLALAGLGTWWVAAPDTARLPRLVGLAQPDAVRALADAGLAPILAPTASTPQDQGRVVAASPDVGAEIDTRSPVTLRVGRGPGLVQVPLLVGRSPDAARTAAEEVGLVLTPIPRRRETDDPAEVGQVVGQDPVPGSLRAAGTAIELVIGERPSTLQVPDVTGRDRASAVATLEGVGLEVTVTEVDTGGAAGTVVATRPGAGATVSRGGSVSLEVARAGTAPTTTTAPPDRSGNNDNTGGSDGSDRGGLFPNGVFGDR